MLGTVLNERYRIDSLIGEGGMASVYMATDLVLRRDVAVKILHPHLAQDSDLCHRFQQEASIAARLEHPNIVKIYDYGQHTDGRSFIVSEVIRGQNLHKLQVSRLRAKKGPFEPFITAMICEEVLKGLHCAHSQSFIHRDVKPDNIMISRDGHVKLTDFGIAKNISSSLTMAGQFLGSPSYSSPEQVQGQSLDRRTDLFSLGIILYEGLTSRLPFTGKTAHEVMLKIAKCTYTDVADISPQCPPVLAGIVRRALKPTPAERFQSAEEMISEIRTYLDSLEVADSRSALEEYSLRPGELLRRVRLKARGLKTPDGRETSDTSTAGASSPRTTPPLPLATRQSPASGHHEESLSGKTSRTNRRSQQGTALRRTLSHPDAPLGRNSRRDRTVEAAPPRAAPAAQPLLQTSPSDAARGNQRAHLKAHPAVPERRDRPRSGLRQRSTQRRIAKQRRQPAQGLSPRTARPLFGDDRSIATFTRRVDKAAHSSPRSRRELFAPFWLVAGGVIMVVLVFRLIVFVAENRNVSASSSEAQIDTTEREPERVQPPAANDESAQRPVNGNETDQTLPRTQAQRNPPRFASGTGKTPAHESSTPAPRPIPRVRTSTPDRKSTVPIQKDSQERVALQKNTNAAAQPVKTSTPSLSGGGSGSVKDLSIIRLSTIPAHAPVSVNGIEKQAIRKSAQFSEFDVPAGRATLTVGPVVAGKTKYMASKSDLFLQPGETRTLGVIRLPAVRTLTLRIRGDGIIAKIDGDPYALRNGELQVERPEGQVDLEISAANGKTLRRSLQLKGDDFTLEASLE